MRQIRSVVTSLPILVGVALLPLEQPLSAGGVVNSCTQSALECALSGGGPVTFACDGAITLTNTLTIAQDTLLDGSGHAVAISGNNAVRIFTVNPGVNFTLVNLTIANGFQASTNSPCGGGIYNNGGIFGATNCTFVSNQVGHASVNISSFGGALYNSNGITTLMQCTFLNNQAIGGDGQGADLAGKSGNGGGVYSGGGTLAVIASSFVGNQARGGYGRQPNGTGGVGGIASGGAIFNAGTLLMTNSTLAINAAISGYGSPDLEDFGRPGNAFGGAVCNSGGTATLVHSTIASNRTVSSCDGDCYYPSNYTSSWTRGGGVFADNGTVTLVNSIVASNLTFFTSTLVTGPANGNCYGSIIDGGHNISSDGSCQFSATGSLTNTDPMLGLLGDHGGPTQVLPLRAGSPAIDAGDDALTNSIATDQRGYARLSGAHVDIGAFEFQGVMLPLRIDSVSRLDNNAVQLAFTNTPDGATFTVIATTNLGLPATNWSNLGFATQTTPGQFQFTDPGVTNYLWRFFSLRSP